MATPFAIPPLLAVAVNGALALYILRSNPRNEANRLFALLMGAIVLWAAGDLAPRLGGDAGSALLWWKFSAVVLGLTVSLFVHFTLAFPRRARLLQRRWAAPALYAPFLVFLASLQATENFYIREMRLFDWGWMPLYADLADLTGAQAALVTVGFACLGLLLLAGMLRLLANHRGASEAERRQIELVLLGLLAAFVPTFVFNLLLPSLYEVYTPLMGSFPTLFLGLFVARAMVKYRFMVQPAAEEARPTKQEHALRSGTAYLVKEERPQRSFEVFVDQVTHGVPGLCVTRTHPGQVRQTHGLEKTPVAWLSHDAAGPEMALERPDEIRRLVRNFAARCRQEGKGCVVLLDGVEYLRTRHGFSETLKLLQDLKDTVASQGSVLVAPVNPAALGAQEMAQLERELEIYG